MKGVGFGYKKTCSPMQGFICRLEYWCRSGRHRKQYKDTKQKFLLQMSIVPATAALFLQGNLFQYPVYLVRMEGNRLMPDPEAAMIT
jgi:hypothetical protein